LETFIYLTVAAVGLLFGSFTNVLIARIPAGESIVTPPSHCSKCVKRTQGDGSFVSSDIGDGFLCRK